MRKLEYTGFISNCRTSFHLCGNNNLVKHQKVSKYLENNCPQNFLLFRMNLLRTPVFRNSHI